MFACRFPKRLGITDYASAHALWDKSPMKKGHNDPDWRDPFGRPRDNTKVIKDSRGQIRFRLYSTDVVTVSPDDTVTLDPVSTNSTNAFVRAVLGGPIWTHWTHWSHPLPDMVTQVGGRLWHTPGFVHIRYDQSSREWRMLGGNVTIDVPQLDRAAARRVLRDSGFKTFELWLLTQIRMGIEPRQGTRWGNTNHTSNNVLRCLDEPDRYGDIARGMSCYGAVADQLAQMRLALYKFHGVIEAVEVDSFADWSEANSAFAKMRKYG